MSFNRQEAIASIIEGMGAMKRLVGARLPKSFAHAPTHAQMGILFALQHRGSQNLKGLAACLHVSPSAATQLVDGLVEQKLLTRTEDAQDRRKTSLALTPRGERTVAELKRAHAVAMSSLFETLTDEELERWHELQQKIIQHAS